METSKFALLIRYATFNVLALLSCLAAFVPADPIPVRYKEGSVHGYLAMCTLEGKVVASGDLIQTVHGVRVASHLVYHFKDGSIDDDMAVSSPRGTFRRISWIQAKRKSKPITSIFRPSWRTEPSTASSTQPHLGVPVGLMLQTVSSP